MGRAAPGQATSNYAKKPDLVRFSVQRNDPRSAAYSGRLTRVRSLSQTIWEPQTALRGAVVFEIEQPKPRAFPNLVLGRPTVAHEEHVDARADGAMDRYASGDEAAFSELYDLIAPRLHRYLLVRARNAERAEDLLQHTFANMHEARGRF